MARLKKHKPEQIVAKLRGADVMLNSGKDLAVVLQSLGVSEATYHRWRKQYGGMKADEAKRLITAHPRLASDFAVPKGVVRDASYRGKGSN